MFSKPKPHDPAAQQPKPQSTSPAAAASTGAPVLVTTNLSKTFSNGGIQQHVLKNLDLDIYAGDFTVIMGPSGAGKSTLLYALAGMDTPSLGSLSFMGHEITGMSSDALAVLRREHCGFVFQKIYLLDNMSVLDNVLAPGLLVSKDRKAVTARAKQLLTQVNLAQSLWGKFPAQLSGGEAQRAAIARALVNHPTVVFADEPTGALNSANGQAVLDALSEVNAAGQSIVMVTHDIHSALRGNRIIYLADGGIRGECQLGTYPTAGAVQSQPAGQQAMASRRQQLDVFLTQMGW